MTGWVLQRCRVRMKVLDATKKAELTARLDAVLSKCVNNQPLLEETRTYQQLNAVISSVCNSMMPCPIGHIVS